MLGVLSQKCSINRVLRRKNTKIPSKSTFADLLQDLVPPPGEGVCDFIGFWRDFFGSKNSRRDSGGGSFAKSWRTGSSHRSSPPQG